MARSLGLLPSALLAARGGMTANAYYQELRALGIAARRSEVLEVFRNAKNIVTHSANEVFANPNDVPQAGEIPAWPSRKATGIMQTVTLVYRDRTTGALNQTYWRTVTPEGMSREAAIAAAVDAYSEHAESYDQDIVGAVHTSAYTLAPGILP